MAIDIASQVVLDPLLADTFTVVRRTETRDTHGRSVKGDQRFIGVVGVVTAISPNNLDRHEGYQVQGRAISIVTQFRIQGESSGFQPDIVLWRGSQFVVKAIDLYPQFGAGFVQVEAVSMDHTDPVLAAPNPGALQFNQASNSMLINMR